MGIKWDSIRRSQVPEDVVIRARLDLADFYSFCALAEFFSDRVPGFMA